MKTAIIGGGNLCRIILELWSHERLHCFSLDIVAIAEPAPNASGLSLARELGVPTYTDVDSALDHPGLEMVIVLAEDRLAHVKRRVSPEIRIMDRKMAQVFRDMSDIACELQEELALRDELDAQMQAEHDKLQKCFDSLPDAIIVLDQDLQVRWANARLREYTGLTPEDLVGEGGYRDPFCRRDADGRRLDIRCSLEEVCVTASPVQLIFMDLDGKTNHTYYRVIITPIFDDDGEIVHIVETARPIDEMVVQAREVKESEQLFRHFVENAHDMITMKDNEGRYLVINDQAAALFGMNSMDLIGRTDDEIFDSNLARVLTRQDQQVLTTNEFMRRQEVLKIGGKTRHLDTARFPLFNYRGDVTGICSISRDMSEEKWLQKALIRSERMAAIGKLAASVAHEINNPLTGVLSFAEELKQDALERDPNDPVIADYDFLIHEAMRCREIVSHLLDFARLGVGRYVTSSLNTVVKRCLSLLQKQAAFQDIDFILELYGEHALGNFDPNQMEQVLLNLIINAAEAMENQGAITLGTGVSEDGTQVEVWVQDQGPGVDPSFIDTIFEPFVSSKGHKGNGFGLSVVQNIVSQHGGTVSLDNDPGNGARFIVRLPLEQNGAQDELKC
jgi:PAS domain S-box-containing protein